MKATDFDGSNVVLGEAQSEYLDLAAYRSHDGEVTSCWKPSLKERFEILFGGRIWLRVLTFNDPLQPQMMFSKNPINDSPGTST